MISYPTPPTVSRSNAAAAHPAAAPHAVVYVYGVAENVKYSLLRSPQWSEVKAWLTRSGVPATWTPRLRGWRVRTEHIGDLIAQAEIAGFAVRMKGALR